MLSKQIQNAIFDDLEQDFDRGLRKVQTIKREKWGDEQNIEYKEVEEMLYLVKVIEQRLKYLAQIPY